MNNLEPKHPLKAQIELIQSINGTTEPTSSNTDYLLLKMFNPKTSNTISFPLSLDMQTINEIDTLALRTGKSRTEIIKTLITFALKHTELSE